MDYAILWPVIEILNRNISCEIFANSVHRDRNQTISKLKTILDVNNNRPLTIIYYVNKQTSNSIYQIFIRNCYDISSFDTIFAYPNKIYIYPEDRINSYHAYDYSKALILFNHEKISDIEATKSYKAHIVVLFSSESVRLDEYLNKHVNESPYTNMMISINNLKNKHYRYKDEYKNTKKSIRSDRFQTLILICILCYVIKCFFLIHKYY